MFVEKKGSEKAYLNQRTGDRGKRSCWWRGSSKPRWEKRHSTWAFGRKCCAVPGWWHKRRAWPLEREWIWASPLSRVCMWPEGRALVDTPQRKSRPGTGPSRCSSRGTWGTSRWGAAGHLLAARTDLLCNWLGPKPFFLRDILGWRQI